ncbi:putative arabinosyltransferase ARAD1 [Iris pallida]|uniref:Arabinosyltransferase ARAD1 n=1 Tax=Iris pallida TaxID=29817 RepID=A0AAX6G622_IRIPA|nr:putative arabinosyltransferase ARAD1 [Iris pallida]
MEQRPACARGGQRATVQRLAVAVVVRMVMALTTRVRVWKRGRWLGFLVGLIPC